MTDSYRSHLRSKDLLALGFHGSRAHPVRAILSALGIAIGIAAMVAVIGISTSSQALVKEKLAALGTNMLTVTAGETIFRQDATLPLESVERVKRLPQIKEVSSTALLDNINVYRNAHIDRGITGGLRVMAAEGNLLKTVEAKLAAGRWLNPATEQFPAVVLGSTAAERLGITRAGTLIHIGEYNFVVVGILQNSPLTPDLDTAALIGEAIATQLFNYDGSPTTLYQRTQPDAVQRARSLLPATVNPEAPGEVRVSRPSDALAAQNAVDQAFTGLLVGVGSIALLVGGIGVANTMIISVLERRREIGLRRSLGATRGHIRAQFLCEAVLLSSYGGVAGALLGWVITAFAAGANGWPTVVPPLVLAASVIVTTLVGAIAGVLPAIRAARTSPTAALSS
ncbi:ABC transporter permease [Lysinibacter sp. HNR]|uniref:ABC transporter permease n=1 Tax=Lysinibacter sp. HNR TaxID=3031408 RepID=UPI00243545A2|nr:ABC transporter permease [Lysinibacter sp. HNR]WGD36256.1 ABC transporter permease [Lysinibacter sp. HNR]